jgi:hypothetical protein
MLGMLRLFMNDAILLHKNLLVDVICMYDKNAKIILDRSDSCFNDI